MGFDGAHGTLCALAACATLIESSRAIKLRICFPKLLDEKTRPHSVDGTIKARIQSP